MIKYSNKSIKGEKFTLVHVSRILQTIREGKVAGVKIAAHITSTVRDTEQWMYTCMPDLYSILCFIQFMISCLENSSTHTAGMEKTLVLETQLGLFQVSEA